MTSPVYTAAQLRAFAWLPIDGSWRANPGRSSPAVSSLSLYHGNLCQNQSGAFGARGGFVFRYRLTEPGIAEKQRLIAEGIIGND